MRIRWPDRTFFAPAIMPLINASHRRFGYLSHQEATRLAKIIYRTGGWLWSTFRWVRGLEFAMMAEDLDPVHFPHWAEDCLSTDATARCPVCGGFIQPPVDGWYAVATDYSR